MLFQIILQYSILVCSVRTQFYNEPSIGYWAERTHALNQPFLLFAREHIFHPKTCTKLSFSHICLHIFGTKIFSLTQNQAFTLITNAFFCSIVLVSFFNAKLGKTLMKIIFLKVLHRFPHPYLHFCQKWKNCRKIKLFVVTFLLIYINIILL